MRTKKISIAKQIVSIIIAAMIISCTVAPVYAAAVTDYVTAMPDVTASMMSADFWLDKLADPNKVILTPAEIAAMNGEAFKSVKYLDNLAEWDSKITGKELRKKINIPFPEGEFYINKTKVASEYWAELKSNMNLVEIKETITVRYGFAVNRVNVKRYPTLDVISDEYADLEYDEFQETAAFIGEPVLVLHESADKRFYYCATKYYGGWIDKNFIALSKTRADWKKAQDYTDFLVVTGNVVKLDENPVYTKLSGMELYMGTKLPLVPTANQPKTISGRQVFGSYVVKVPVRDKDGYAVQRSLPIPVSRDVTVGYLPYTYTNVMNQLFKMQGDRYGWGGMLNARDGSSLTQELYRCFGFELPRNGNWQAEYVGHKIDLTEKTAQEKDAIITNQVKPGALLQFPGHITVYLGKHNGKHYVMSSSGGYGVYSEKKKDYEYSRTFSVYINTMDVKRTNGKSWLEMLATVVCLDK